MTCETILLPVKFLKQYLLVAVQSLLIPSLPAQGDTTVLDIRKQLAAIERVFDGEVNGWKAHEGDPIGAETPDFDDSAWHRADVGFTWTPDSICWLRRVIEIPKIIRGVPIAGAQVSIRLKMDNCGRIYVNGDLKQEFEWGREEPVVLVESARPGDRVVIAIRGDSAPYPGFRPWPGALNLAGFEVSTAAEVLPRVDALLERVQFATELIHTGNNQRLWLDGILATLAALDPVTLGLGNIDGFLVSLEKAESVFRQRVIGLAEGITSERLATLAPKVTALQKIMQGADKRGVDLSYQRVTLTVAENFDRYALEDLASDDMEHVVRGVWNADWLAGAVPAALAEAEAILRRPSLQRKVPRYTTGPVRIERGAFWQKEQPRFFVGMGHFGDVRRDIPIFPHYGFNIAQITISVSSVLRGEDEINLKPIEDVLKVLDRAAEANVAIDLLLEPHGWPRWAIEKYPELEKEKIWIDFKIDHPKAQEILDKYWSILIPKIAGHPALFSYCLFNEPRYDDHSEYSFGKFLDWMRAKHGTVAVLNQRHNASYKTFDDLPNPVDESVRPLWYDWARFNQERFGAVHQRMIDTIHALDPDTPVHAKVQAMLFGTHRVFSSGIDHEQWASQGDISGNDNYSYYRKNSGSYSANWLRQSMYYNFQRSVAPDHPIFNSENHPIEDNGAYWVAGRHLRTMYWEGAILGQGATTTWVWQRDPGESLGHCILTRANCTEALGKVALDLLRLGNEVVTLQQIEPEIALLLTPASIPFSEDYLDEMKTAYDALYFLGAPIGFVTDRQARNGGLSAFKAVFVPAAKRVEDDVVSHLAQYAEQGGTVVVTGDSFAMDEYGQTRDVPPSLRGDASLSTLGAARPVGKGRVMWRPAPWSAQGYRTLGEDLMTDLNVARPIRVTDEKGRLVEGVSYRSTRYKNGYLLNMTSYRSHEKPVRIVAPEPIAQITNLFDGTRARDFFELEALDPQLLYIEVAKK